MTRSTTTTSKNVSTHIHTYMLDISYYYLILFLLFSFFSWMHYINNLKSTPSLFDLINGSWHSHVATIPLHQYSNLRFSASLLFVGAYKNKIFIIISRYIHCRLKKQQWSKFSKNSLYFLLRMYDSLSYSKDFFWNGSFRPNHATLISLYRKKLL